MKKMPLTRPLKDSDDLLKLDEKELDELCHELVLYEFNFAKNWRLNFLAAKRARNWKKIGD